MIRDQQLIYGMRAFAILGFFALLSSLSRIFTIGWHDLMYLHIALYLVILTVALAGRYLSFAFRAGIVVAISFILGVGGLLSWGLASFGLLSIFCFCILSAILFGTRAGIVSSAVSILIIGIIGACVRVGILTFDLDTKVYLTSMTAWLGAMIVMILYVGTIVVTLGALNRQIEDLAHTLEKQNEKLQEQNKSLQNQIAERTRAEEERRKAEDRLQAAKKMEAVGTLAGGVAHDLNNILGSIVNYPDMMLEELPMDSPMRHDLEAIKKSAIKAAAIVNDMLTLARRRIDKTEIVNLNSIVSEYCASPEFATLKKYHPLVEVEIRLDQKLANIHGSPFHLSKVVMNLVSNAAEAMPDGGRMLISTENRRVDDRIGSNAEINEGEYSVLCIADTGVGIPHEDLERIFEPFYSKKKMGRSGTGLGMAVVWGSVMDHSGYIDLESLEGKGTKFTLYFPATQEQLTPAKSVSPGMELRGRGESILVVDDVSEQREITTRILQGLGYTVLALASGEEAIKHLHRASADLLILDMLMEPGIDGLETYKRIAEFHPGQKVLITTGYAETERLKEALRLGRGGYLKKPYLVDEIGLAVKAELEKRSQEESSLGIYTERRK